MFTGYARTTEWTLRSAGRGHVLILLELRSPVTRFPRVVDRDAGYWYVF